MNYKKTPLPPPFLPDPIFHWVDLSGKNNYQPNISIGRDGIAIQRVRLSVGDERLREEIIAKHFFQHLSCFDVMTDFKIHKRDDPWDFLVESNLGYFNLEITSISDSDYQFRWLSDQDKIRSYLKKKAPSIREINSLKKRISEDFFEEMRLAKEKEDKYSKIILKGADRPPPEFKHALLSAIERKEKKNHPDKDQTILLIDNRMSAPAVADFLNLSEEMSSTLQKYTFYEIWIYTGCCSDDDGTNAVFSIYPLKY